VRSRSASLLIGLAKQLRNYSDRAFDCRWVETQPIELAVFSSLRGAAATNQCSLHARCWIVSRSSQRRVQRPFLLAALSVRLSRRLRRISRLQPRAKELRPGDRGVFGRPVGTDAGRQTGSAGGTPCPVMMKKPTSRQAWPKALATAWACSGWPFTKGATLITGMALTGVSSKRSLIRKQYLCPKLSERGARVARSYFTGTPGMSWAWFSERRARR